MKITGAKNFLAYMYVIMAACLVLFFVNSLSIDSNNLTGKYDVTPLSLSGTYRTSPSGTWQAFTDLQELTGQNGEPILLKGHISTEVPAGQEIIMYLYHLNASVWINGNLVFRDDHRNYTQWETFSSPGITPSDEIKIRLNGRHYTESLILFRNNLYSGTSYGILLHQLRRNALKIFFGIVIFILGIAFLAATVTLRLFGIHIKQQLIPCALLLMASSACTLTDFDYITLLIPHPVFINYFDYLAQLIIFEFLIIYLSTYLRNRRSLLMARGMTALWTVFTAVYCFFPGLWDQRLFMVLIITILCIDFMLLFHEYRQYGEIHLKYVFLSSCVLTISAIAEIIHYYMTNVYWVYVFQTGLFLFTAAQCHVLLRQIHKRLKQAERAQALEEEITQNRIRLMLSQIRPHFVFNTLNAISSLCLTAPEKADAAILLFSNYLRGNINSLQGQGMSTFKEELKHIQCYVSIEQMRFGNKIKVEYHTDIPDFKLPTLTLEPLVENAIKHGISAKAGGGTVTVAARQEPDDSITITVADDGIGFDPASLTSGAKASIGLTNVRRRLEYTLNATMCINSVPGTGTTITIHIPQPTLAKGEPTL